MNPVCAHAHSAPFCRVADGIPKGTRQENCQALQRIRLRKALSAGYKKAGALMSPGFLLSVFLWPETKKGSAFPQTLISFLVELRRIELLTS